ncbi:MAG: apolipoprotein N-acyltransferase [Sphingomicrobium sp.]
MFRSFLMALALGLLSALAFQPVGWWPMMTLAIAGLAELLSRQKRLGGALIVGWGFGVGQFVLGLHWIATAFTFQAAMPAWLGWVAVVLLSLYLAVYPMIAAGLGWRFGKDRPLALALALAGSWAITEWLRATMFTGFAWNPIGVTLVDTPLLPVSRFVGTYSLSAIVVGIGSAIWLAGRGRWRESIALLVPIGLLSLVPVTTLAPAGPRQAIRIVQPNIGQDVKWSPDFEAMATARLNALSSPRAERKELIFWPEAAVTSPLSDTRPAAGPFVEMERRLATRTVGADDLLLTGGIALRSSDGRRVDAAANSVFVLGPGGDFVGRYDKSHLVPYGEYLPMRPILSAIGLSRLAPGDSDFIAGPGPGSLPLPDGLSAGFQLCYEIIFSGQVVNRAHRPDFIFNPSNDAWFGAFGPPQHLAQARLRASEEGLPIIRSTPTGISALVDARGRIVDSVPWKRAGIIWSVLPRAAASVGPFARFGNAIPLFLGAILLFAAIALGRSRRYSTAI